MNDVNSGCVIREEYNSSTAMRMRMLRCNCSYLYQERVFRERDVSSWTGVCIFPLLFLVVSLDFQITEVPALTDESVIKNFGADQFNAVCYVIPISRFTQDEANMFDRVKAVLGEAVLQHMILIFTYGDQLEVPGSRAQKREELEARLQNAPDALKRIVSDCGRRYVVFSNVAGDSEEQVKDLLDIVKSIDNTVDM